ncbi:MAG: glycosyltransferase family 2 protein [Gammaproteobacteria bacterium]|jgi:glycosyltransferase involved in cell wall biosynthesis
MATTPYFILSPNTVLSIIGLIHGPDKTVPVPAEDWRTATVDVVIPAYNEESNIPLCLAALARQTRKPTRIILIDDGSHDRTVEYARTFCTLNGMDLIAIQRAHSIGKTPTLKRQSREFDSDVEFILDGDTVLESDDYIDRVVEELYKGAGIASACGTVLPLRDRDRRAMLETEALKTFLEAHPEASIYPRVGWLHRLQRGITNLYRDVLYFFLQKFVYRGQMAFFGSILNPVGCAVAYRREVLKTIVFDRYEPLLGDDLTNSEDIFIGFAMNDHGYRNIQVTDVYARSQEPEVSRVPAQVYLWSSSFLQSCYYFDELMRSPFKGLRRWRHKKAETAELAHGHAEHRAHPEQYRQPFGIDHTLKYGRPIGWVLFMSAFEKVAFPTALLIMLLLQMWEPLAITLIAETLVATTVLAIVAKGKRLEYFLKGLVVTPLRYTVLLYDLVTIGRFAADLWIFRNRRWRK